MLILLRRQLHVGWLLTVFVVLNAPTGVGASPPNPSGVIPEVVIHNADLPSFPRVDLLLRTTRETVVVDPFFRAPGLDFAELIVHSGSLDFSKAMMRCEIPRWRHEQPRDLRELPPGSLLVPGKAFTGASFWLSVQRSMEAGADSEKKRWFLTLVRYRSPRRADAAWLPEDVDAVSESVPLGIFSSPVVRLLPLDSARIHVRSKSAAAGIVLPDFRVRHNGEQTVFDVQFLNVSDQSVEVFSPLMEFCGATIFPAHLWVEPTNGSAKKTDVLNPNFRGKAPAHRMMMHVPPGAIAGGERAIDLPPGEYSSSLQLLERFLTDPASDSSPDRKLGWVDGGDQIFSSEPIHFHKSSDSAHTQTGNR